MDINDIRSAVTVGGFVLFLALVRWVWDARRRSAFRRSGTASVPGRDSEEDRQ